MSVFTEYHRSDGDVEVYAATNRFMRFAIEVMDSAYSPVARSHSAIAQWFNNLLPIELKELAYLPADQMMFDWANLFFANRARGGLIPTLAQQSGRRYYDSTSGNWVHRPGDSRIYGVLEGLYASTVSMIGRMHDFLSWFPPDTALADSASLLDHCKTWADAFKQTNRETNWYGHRVDETSWKLYNFVHAGPPRGAPENTLDPEIQFRFAFEGFPDSWWVTADAYGAVAQAFVHLSQASGDREYADFAATLTDGLWNSRLNQRTFLMPDTFTPMGALPGDQDVSGQFKYMHDTDCLYWARRIFAAYGLVAGPQPSQIQNTGSQRVLASGERGAFRRQTLRRRQRCSRLIAGDYPDKYLGVALGLTLDWMRYGWVPEWKQFIRKIHHDGTPGNTALYGDGRWNTLYVLIEAYRFTADTFYLDVFDQAWSLFEELAQAAPLGGLFPQVVDSGGLPGDPAIEPLQEMFLDVVVAAYCATADAGVSRAQYLSTAESLADRILAAHQAGTNYYAPYNGVLPRALVRLAKRNGALSRVSLSVRDPSVSALRFSNASIGALDVDLMGHGRAVVYMDAGDYQVSKLLADGTQSTPIALAVAGDAEVGV